MFGHKTKEQKIEDASKSIYEAVREFRAGDGRLPSGFLDSYCSMFSDGTLIMRTPFEAYLRTIRSEADSICDRSGISDWIYFDGNMTIDQAACEISSWVKKNREMKAILSKMCRIGNTTIFAPFSSRCDERVMIVTDDSHRTENISSDTVRICREMDISFCTILSDRDLYDLIEQKKMSVTYVTYPNYHDEIYADWSIK